MSNELSPLDRLNALIQAAIDAGRFTNQAEFLREVGVTRGYLGSWGARLAENPGAGITAEKANAIARVLRMSTDALLDHLFQRKVEVHDKYPNRQWAIDAARMLQFPESAIQAILAEDPGVEQERLWWFHRIEAEAQRIRPAASPKR